MNVSKLASLLNNTDTGRLTFHDIFDALDAEDQDALVDALRRSTVADVLHVCKTAGLQFTQSMLKDAKTRLCRGQTL